MVQAFFLIFNNLIETPAEFPVNNPQFQLGVLGTEEIIKTL
jgi:hypothetical protein